MALWVRSRSCRIASLISLYESTLVKSTRASSTNMNLETSSYKEDSYSEVQNPQKKRFAVLIGYRGAGYYGVCLNPGQDNIPTVGKEIVTAMMKAGYMDESDLLSTKSLSQASRTDSGVSALKQIIAMNVSNDVDLDNVRPHLSEDIKIYGIIPTVKRFIPFRFCDGRSYLYYIPSYVFSPHTMEMHKDYRLTGDTVNKINRLLKKFLGNKNYHNFTKGRSFHDPRAMRKISNIELLEPVIKDGFELACVRLEGTSFILNQIRKIIGALVLAVRGLTPESFIDIALSKEGILVGCAPPLGLMLEDLDFQWYNKKFKRNGIEPIDFSKYDKEVEALRDRILSTLVAAEAEYEKTKLWVESLQYIPFRPFNKEQLLLDSTLEYDDTLYIIRSESVSVSGKDEASLFT